MGFNSAFKGLISVRGLGNSNVQIYVVQKFLIDVCYY